MYMERYSVIFLSGTEGGEVLYNFFHIVQLLVLDYHWLKEDVDTHHRI